MLIFENHMVQEEYLLCADPNKVYSYLENLAPDEAHTENNKAELDRQYSTETLLKVYARNEPLINLALAQYTNNIELFVKMLKKENTNIRCCIFSNIYLFNFHINEKKQEFDDNIYLFSSYKELKTFIEKSPKEEIEALFSNHNLNKYTLENVLDKKSIFKSIKHSKYLEVLKGTVNNPFFSLHPDSEEANVHAGRVLGDHVEYEDVEKEKKIIKKAFMLFKTLDVTDENRDFLVANFMGFSPKPGPLYFSGSIKNEKKFLEEMFKKWKTDPKNTTRSTYTVNSNLAFKFANCRETVRNFLMNQKDLKHKVIMGMYEFDESFLRKEYKKDKDMVRDVSMNLFNAGYKSKAIRETIRELFKDYEKKSKSFAPWEEGDNYEVGLQWILSDEKKRTKYYNSWELADEFATTTYHLKDYSETSNKKDNRLTRTENYLKKLTDQKIEKLEKKVDEIKEFFLKESKNKDDETQKPESLFSMSDIYTEVSMVKEKIIYLEDKLASLKTESSSFKDMLQEINGNINNLREEIEEIPKKKSWF